MGERPILFSAPMIRAILADQKTQTRRVVRPSGSLLAMSWSPLHPERGLRVTTRTGKHSTHTGPVGEALSACPYGQPGDRLWVRETHRVKAWNEVASARVEYRADGSEDCLDVLTDDYDAWILQRTAIWERAGARVRADGLLPEPPGGVPWTPSIHMPRWASRLTLEVTSVRVERLHDITEADARAEGVDWSRPEPYGEKWDDDREDPREVGYPPAGASFARDNFRRLWSSINGPESWEANPWVWVVGFRRVEVRGD